MRDFGGSMKREDYDGVFKALGDEHTFSQPCLII